MERVLHFGEQLQRQQTRTFAKAFFNVPMVGSEYAVQIFTQILSQTIDKQFAPSASFQDREDF